MQYKKILIAVDHSSCSDHAASHGLELAAALDAEVVLVCVIDEAKAVSNPDAGFGMSDAIRMLEEEADATLAAIAARGQNLRITTLKPAGDPMTDILGTAEATHADLIVMGTHGRTGIKHMILGSVAEYVVRHSKIPVLVVPGK